MYSYQVAILLQLRRNHIDKLDFLEAFKPVRVEVLSSSNICSGFAEAGLMPYNLERVLLFSQHKLQTPTFHILETTIAVCQTFRTRYIVVDLA